MSFAQPFKDYEILERLGAGAMGTVFKARHAKLGRTVALKVLRPSLARNERFVERLGREARIVASLNHPNIVTGYDLGQEGGYHFFVMEYVEGRSLRQLLAEWGMFPEDQVLNVALQVARALDHAYQKGVIHRDVKPGNILIDQQGRVKLTDMGLAKGPADLTLTKDGATVGTPQYISPEQARNPQEVDIRSDLYSLGATLYHMATGQPAFRGDTMAEVITKVLHERATSATEINPRLSDGLSLVIRKLLAKDMGLRYQTPAELIEDLERVARDEAPEVDRGRLDAEDAGQVPGRRRAVQLSVAAVLLVALSLLVGFLLRGQGTEGPTAEQRVLKLLEERLEALSRLSARLSLLQSYEERESPALREQIRLRRDMVLNEVQREVDAVARGWIETQDELAKWLNDEGSWPTAEEFERERLIPELLQRADFRPEDLPPQIRRTHIDRLMEVVRDEVRRRDQNLLEKFRAHLRERARATWMNHLAQQDFAAAETTIRKAMASFFDGDHPLPTRLSPDTLASAEELYRTALRDALVAIDDAESRLVDRMQKEAESRLSELEDMLGGRTSDPARVAREADRLENDLRSRYPAEDDFRAGADPWPALQVRFKVFQSRLRLAETAWQEQRLESRLAFAYGALERGNPASVLEYLADLGFPQGALEQDLHRHRQWLGAAAAVLAPVLATLHSSSEPLTCRLRADPITRLELRVTRGADGFEIEARPPGGDFHRLALSDLVLRDLLQQAQRLKPDMLAQVSPEQRERGRQMLAWLSGDLAAAPTSVFALEEVLPRLARARAERERAERDPAAGEDPRISLERVVKAHVRSVAGGDVGELEEAIRYHDRRHADASLGEDEARQLAESRRWLQAEQRRRSLLADLQRRTPPRAAVTVQLERDGLDAEIVYPAEALRPLASEQGWVLAGDRLAFVRENTTLARLPEQRMEIASGLQAETPELSCALEVVFPAHLAAARVWLFEFQGVLLVLALRGDDAVVPVLTEVSSLSNSDVLQRELRRALGASLEKETPVAVPGAVHRLELESTRLRGRSRVRFRALLDGLELARWTRSEHEEQAQATLRVYPMQPFEVQRVVFVGRGL